MMGRKDSSPKQKLYRSLILNTDFGLFIVTVVLFAVVAIFSDSFLNSYNIYNLARNIALLSFIGICQAVVIVIGHMNLSIGSIAGLSAVTAGYLLSYAHVNIWLAIFLSLLVGIICGAINGVIIAKGGIDSFIVTLTTMFIFTGVNYGLTYLYSFDNLPKIMTFIGRGDLFGIPLVFIFMIITLIILSFFYKFSITGRRTLAIGQNIEAARFFAINIPNLTIFNHILSGFIAAVGALLYVSKNGSASPTVGSDWLIISFSVAILGGTTLTGGRISSFGLFLGATIMVIIKNAMVLLKMNIYYQQVFLGLLILFAVGFDRIKTVYIDRKISIS